MSRQSGDPGLGAMLDGSGLGCPTSGFDGGLLSLANQFWEKGSSIKFSDVDFYPKKRDKCHALWTQYFFALLDTRLSSLAPSHNKRRDSNRRTWQRTHFNFRRKPIHESFYVRNRSTWKVGKRRKRKGKVPHSLPLSLFLRPELSRCNGLLKSEGG